MTDDSIRQRKLDHLALAMSDDMKALSDPGWSDVTLLPTSLPTVNPAEVDLNTEFLGANPTLDRNSSLPRCSRRMRNFRLGILCTGVLSTFTPP